MSTVSLISPPAMVPAADVPSVVRVWLVSDASSVVGELMVDDPSSVVGLLVV